jgi:hypothetical protein
VPDGISGANVDEGGPQLPTISAEQRQERIDELAEANAKRRVLEFEKKYKMHTVKKHSSEIPDAALKQRAIDGTDPHTGRRLRDAKGNPSSQFNNWKVHLSALNKALSREALGLNPHTGKDHNKDPIVRMELPGAGRGYKPNKKNQTAPKLNENMNWSEVKFDQGDVKRPYTGFPSEKK